MKINGFQIYNYRSIMDSGWVDVQDLTVLVGKNESGKTSLLRALHKFNPFKPDPYSIDKERPRGHRRSRNQDAVVCRVGFTFEPNEIAELSSLVDDKAQCGPFIVSRTYAGAHKVDLSDDVFPSRPSKNETTNLLRSVTEIRLPQSTAISSEFFNQCLERINELALAGDMDAISRAATDLSGVLLANMDAPSAEDSAFVQRLAASFAGFVANWRSRKTIKASVERYVLDHLPVFIYMDDYRAFRGTALLDQVKGRKDSGALTDEDKTLITIMELSGLALDSEYSKGQSDSEVVREQRIYDLNDAGLSLTREIAERWKQRKYEVEFRADRQSFFTMVRDETGPHLIPLEERSKGFQWFFSFDLMFMYESRGSFKGCVLLLDEPGLHLHASAQRDLVERLEAYASNNSLIYTTHLPFMIDLRKPERIRTISETPEGTVVDKTLNLSQPDAKLTLQSALGMSASTSYLVAQRNLVVEGVDDFMILTELSNLLIRSGLTGLPEDVHVTAAGGASEAAYLATFMIGQNLDVVVLLDSDKAGSDAADKLIKSWLTRYGKGHSQVLKIGDVLGVAGECATEDLFPDAFYLEKTQAVYGQRLSAAGISQLTLEGDGQLVKRVERALNKVDIPFNKGSVAKLIRSAILKMADVNSLPAETKDRAQRLVAAITQAMPTA
jgi:energy-coupling factor transporter ATP-binding protein EcfA2